MLTADFLVIDFGFFTGTVVSFVVLAGAWVDLCIFKDTASFSLIPVGMIRIVVATRRRLDAGANVPDFSGISCNCPSNITYWGWVVIISGFCVS